MTMLNHEFSMAIQSSIKISNGSSPYLLELVLDLDSYQQIYCLYNITFKEQYELPYI